MTRIQFKDVDPVPWWLLPAQGHSWAGEVCCFSSFFHQHREVQRCDPVLFECQIQNIWWQWQLCVTRRRDLFSLSLHICFSQLFFQYTQFCFSLFLLLLCSSALILFWVLLFLLTYGGYMIHHWVQPCPLNKQKIPYVLEGGISYRPFSLSLSFSLSQLKLYFWTAVTMRHCKLKTTTWALSSEALSGPDTRHGGEISSALKL